MTLKKTLENERDIEKEQNGYVKIDWGRQGGVILGYVFVLLFFYGIIANIVMIDQYGRWISFVDMDRTILVWPYLTFVQTFFLPALVLFFISFILTYKEEIPHYGIKASIWMVPCLIVEGWIFYWIMFGFSLDPLLLQFADVRGYINILVLLGIALLGAISGMYLKRYTVSRKEF